MKTVKRVERSYNPGQNGRPRHVATTKNRKKVSQLVATGVPQLMICKYLGISVPTLHRYYRKELDTAEIDLLNSARRTIAYNIKKGETDAAKFVLKTRGREYGWTERIEMTGKDGTPLFDLSKLTDSELDQLEALQRKAAATQAKLENDEEEEYED